MAKEDAEKKKTGVVPDLSKDEKKRRLEIFQAFTKDKKNDLLLTDLGERGYAIHSVHDGATADTTVRVRGVEEKHGPTVPRGFLTVLNCPILRRYLPATADGWSLRNGLHVLTIR